MESCVVCCEVCNEGKECCRSEPKKEPPVSVPILINLLRSISHTLQGMEHLPPDLYYYTLTDRILAYLSNTMPALLLSSQEFKDCSLEEARELILDETRVVQELVLRERSKALSNLNQSPPV